MAIRKMTIGGFRGILTPLTFDFQKGGSERSIIIYGRNGTGKSSITDAWEWFHLGKIGHLAREGARESSYPHREARQGETFVEVEFSGNQDGALRVEYDFDRVTKPKIRGDIKKFRQNAPHPCHLRYNDLTTFVFATKADQYDSLARLMGFTPQVEVQKSLRRVQRRILDEKDRAETTYKTTDQDIRNQFGFNPADTSQYLRAVNLRFSRNAERAADSLPEIDERYEQLRMKVTADPVAQELGSVQTAQRLLSQLKINSQFPKLLQDYYEQITSLRGREASYLKQLLIQLYEKGIEILSEEAQQGLETNRCPLCGKLYDGSLLQHVQSELGQLRELKARRDELERQRMQLLKQWPQENSLSQPVSQLSMLAKHIAVDFKVDDILSLIQEAENILTIIRELLQGPPENLSDDQVKSILQNSANLSGVIDSASRLSAEAGSTIKQRFDMLTADTARKQLVEDYDWISQSRNLHSRWEDFKKRSTSLNLIASEFTNMVDSYSSASLDDVESKFSGISNDVKKYFHILEKGTEGISDPSLKLLLDQDRAVMLEIVFHNETIFPAYKYLSESQLNSFGLAVFLASAKSFNRDFKFLILDDVVNSFDGYKRPRVIDLLHQELSDFQLMLLTHDSVWWNQLMEHFPAWIRLHFKKIEYGSGPIVSDGKTELDSVKILLDDDQPVYAGRNFGAYLERKLQEICESFEAPVPFRRTNEYTLRELIQRFLSRVKEKLGGNHNLYSLVSDLDSNAGFRNFCMHWKNPDTEITVQEISSALSIWEKIVASVYCPNPDCSYLLKYDGNNRFICHCGATVLSRS